MYSFSFSAAIDIDSGITKAEIENRIYLTLKDSNKLAGKKRDYSEMSM